MEVGTSVLRKLKVIQRILGMQLGRSIQYRVDFLWSVASSLAELAVVVVFFGLVYRPDSTLTRFWPWGRMLWLLGVAHLVNGIHRFLFAGLNRLGDLVERGELDLLLARPIHPLTLISWSRPSVSALLALPGAIPLLYYGAVLHPPRLGANLPLFLVYLAVGVLMRYHLAVCTMLGSFWLVRAHALYYTVEELASLMRYPIVIFEGAGAIVLKYLLPVVLIANVPVLALFGELDALLAVYPVVFVAALHLAARILWSRGLAAYTSAGG